MLDAESSSNRFGLAMARVHDLHAAVHQGLRRGELLSFQVNVIKSAFDRKQQRVRYWMDVRYNRYENASPILQISGAGQRHYLFKNT
jgi:hypothetical protein